MRSLLYIVSMFSYSRRRCVDDPGSLDVLIYAQLLPDPSSSSSLTVSSTSRAQPRMIRLRAARILPGPPPPALQNPRPRPDEPAPRAPPWMLFSSASKRKRDEEAGGNGKRSKAEVRAKDREASVEALRKAREVMLRMPRPGTNAAASGQDAKVKEKDRDKTSSKGKGKATGNMGEFKIPSVPSRVRSMSGTGLNSTEEEKLEADDVFGSFDDMGNVRKEKMTQDPDEVERSNKTVSDTYLAAKVNCVGYFFSCYKVIKQATVRALADAGIVKGHPEFNDLFQYIYRGTAFALVRIISPSSAILICDPTNNLCTADTESKNADWHGGPVAGVQGRRHACADVRAELSRCWTNTDVGRC